MAEPDGEEPGPVLKNLAEAVTTQAQIANRLWIATITVAFFLIIPGSPAEVGPAIRLPFELGQAQPNLFYPVVFVILAVMSISLAVAHVHQIRAHRLAQRVVNQLARGYSSAAHRLHPRDLFDILRVASLSRVGPLAQWLRGKQQFAESDGDCPLWRRTASTSYYVVVKLLALIVVFVVPGAALVHGFRLVLVTEIGRLLLAFIAGAGALAVLSLALAALADTRYAFDVARMLAKKRAPESPAV